MTVSAVYSAVRRISESIGSLPLHVYKRLDGGGKAKATDHPLYAILHDMPNPEMTSMVFRETLMTHLLLWGNAYAMIEFNKRGQVIALWPLAPYRVQPYRDLYTWQIYYTVMLPGGQVKTLQADEMLHIPGLGFNGLVGHSPIHMARESIGIALATEEFGARFFSNGANVGGVARHPGKLSEQGSKNLRASINDVYGGLGKSHKVMLLEEGMEFEKVAIPPNDAQFLETRKFQVTEIARWFNIQPHMIADMENATFSNIEQQSLEFVVHTIRPWLVRWEQAIYQKLLLPQERTKYFAEFLVDGLLRGDIKSRYDAYAVARQNGWLSANDIRENENMNPITGGDVYLVNGNMIPAEKAGTISIPAQKTASLIQELDTRNHVPDD